MFWTEKTEKRVHPPKKHRSEKGAAVRHLGNHCLLLEPGENSDQRLKNWKILVSWYRKQVLLIVVTVTIDLNTLKVAGPLKKANKQPKLGADAIWP